MCPFAFECFADQDLFLVLRDECHLPLVKVHSYSQGEVVNDVLLRARARIGLVDEDPGRSHHRRRDQMQVLSTTDNVEFRQLGDRYLIVLRPELEGCFLRGIELAGIGSELPDRRADLERHLADPDPRRSVHRVFREELGALRKRTDSFVAEIEQFVKGVLPPR